LEDTRVAHTILSIAALFVNILAFAIFARAILSWFPMNQRSPIVATLNRVTDPILTPLRRVVPRLGMIDLTPMIAMIVLLAVGRMLQQAMVSA
jgi:YggT family protein